MSDNQAAMPDHPLAPKPSLWPLAWTIWVDLLIIASLVVILNLVVSIVIGTLAVQQGLTLYDSNGAVSVDRLTFILGPIGFTVIITAQSLIFSLVPLARVVGLRQESLAQIGFRAARPLHLAAQGIGLGLVLLALNLIIANIFSQLGISQNQSDNFPLRSGDLIGQILIAIAVSVIGPLGEEILFRGYIFNALLQSWGRLAAYLISALLFSLAHSLAATQGISALLAPTFIIGLVLAWNMHRTGSLLPSFIAHATNNSIAVSLLIGCASNSALCAS
ncbi:MAG: CPBP family intramembrane metalloprotease [Chloroflexales bacterium]|nr:CPBP family intramembrane metalloprotease [Chloroflexales bacterium]